MITYPPLHHFVRNFKASCYATTMSLPKVEQEQKYECKNKAFIEDK